MSEKLQCPNYNSPEWMKLVEEVGGERTAFEIWSEPTPNKLAHEYPANIIAEAESDTSNGVIPATEVNERVMEQKQVLVSAQERLLKKANQIRNRAFTSEEDNQEIADLEALVTKIEDLEAGYAVEAFVDMMSKKSTKIETFLDEVRSGKIQPSLRMYAQIKEFESTLALVESLLPEIENDPEFSEAAAIAKNLLSSAGRIKTERKFQQTKLLTTLWAPKIGVIDSHYRQLAQRKFNKDLRKDYNGAEAIKKARDEYITQYMIDTSDRRIAETKQYAAELFSKIKDVSSNEGRYLNPKDINNEISRQIVQLLDKADYTVRNRVMEEAADTDRLYKSYTAHMKEVGEYSVVPEKLYAPILEVDLDGNLTGNYIGPDSPGNQHAEMRRKYKGTPVMEFYVHLLTKQVQRDRKLSEAYKLDFRIPRVNKKLLERVQTQGAGTVVKNTFTELTRLKDSTDLGELGNIEEEHEATKNGEELRVIVSESGEVVKKPPVHYRSRALVEVADMSYDLATINVMDEENVANYEAKQDASIIIDTVLDLVHDGSAEQKEGNKKLIDHATDKLALKSGSQSNLYSLLEHLREVRVYGIGTKGSKTRAHRAKQVQHYTSLVSMGLNMWSAATNVTQGGITAAIESLGGSSGLYTPVNYARAIKKVGLDTPDLVLDEGRNIVRSKTRLLLKRFNSSEGFEAINHDFGKTNAATKFAQESIVYAPQSVSETAAQALVMYSILDNIKVKNKAGEYINKAGEVVATREEAMTIDEAYTVVDGKLVANTVAEASEQSEDMSTDGVFKVANLVSRTTRDLFGSYNSQNKSMFKATITGSFIMQMKGWLITGLAKRFKGYNLVGVAYGEERVEDLRYNAETEKIEMGHYMEAIRFLSVSFKGLLDAQRKISLTENWQVMTEEEKKRITIAAVEFAVAMILPILANAMLDDEDEDSLTYKIGYLTLRVGDEFQTYFNPKEMSRLISNPAVASKTLLDITEILAQFLSNPVERYETGVRKGELKIMKEISDISPIIKQINKNLADDVMFRRR